MKTTKYIITAILAIASLGVSAQKLRIDAKKSTIGWIGKKIGGQHEGSQPIFGYILYPLNQCK